MPVPRGILFQWAPNRARARWSGSAARMSVMKGLWLIGCALVLVGVSYAYQGPFREYPSVEYGVPVLPRDYQEKTEFAFARMMYPPGWNDGYRGRFDGDWRRDRKSTRLNSSHD